MLEKELLIKKANEGYTVCYEEQCPLRDHCLRWQVGQHVPHTAYAYTCVNPNYQGVANAQWQEFRKFAEEYLTDFYQHINRRDLELTDQEILVCILTRLQFIPTEQAALLDVSKQRITNLRSSINQKLFDEKSSKTLEKNILNLCS